MRKPKHILITGASSGIGAALAHAYAAPAIRLSLHGRNADRLSGIAYRAKQNGAEVSTHAGDVTDAGDLAVWIAAQDSVQPIDLVIANAGVSAGTGNGPETQEQSWKIFAVNVSGVLNTVQPALGLMRERRRGQIAIMSSLAGFFGAPGAPTYSASKAAVRIYGEALRGEAAASGIAVNVICPGFVRTPMTDVNKFPMPFIMPVEKAARIIKRRLARNKARIAFPWPMYLIVRILGLMPSGWLGRRAARMYRKPAFDKACGSASSRL